MTGINNHFENFPSCELRLVEFCLSRQQHWHQLGKKAFVSHNNMKTDNLLLFRTITYEM